MSKWTEKNKRIDVPYICQNKFVCVEHPAYVSNPSKAIATLGSEEQIAKVYADSMKRLPLHWRPTDFYCKPAYGDRCSVTNILMKVKRRRRKSDGKEDFMVEIIGVVDTSYKFQAMCDFQYLPMKTRQDGTHESIYEKVHISSLVSHDDYFSQDVPLYMPPITFSRVDRPCDFLYKQETEHRNPKYINPDLTRAPNLIGTVRQRRTLHTIFVNFGEKIPIEPVPEAVERMSSEFIDPKGIDIVKKILDKKPLYLKCEIEHLTGFHSNKLKSYLPALCFYWLDGPWRGQWNKFGFDPTKEPSAKIHQTIDFRIRQLKPGQFEVKAKRDQMKLIQWKEISRNQKHNVKISLKSLKDQDTSKKEDSVTDKELYYKFKPSQIPPHRMMYYPACYVYIDEVQKLLHENDGQETMCNEKDGWCIADFNTRCRDLMYHYVNKLLSLGDSVEYKFWRTKKKKRQIEMLQLESEDDSDKSENETEINRQKSDTGDYAEMECEEMEDIMANK